MLIPPTRAIRAGLDLIEGTEHHTPFLELSMLMGRPSSRAALLRSDMPEWDYKSFFLWNRRDSNPLPSQCHCDALPDELRSRAPSSAGDCRCRIDGPQTLGPDVTIRAVPSCLTALAPLLIHEAFTPAGAADNIRTVQ